jgi:hypothetical protein
MAKKAKAAKAKKAKKAKKAAPTPTYLRGPDPVHIPAHRVADVLKMIHKHGHTAKFKRQAKAAGAVMTLHPKTVNFVKDFVAKNAMHADPVGKQVINSDGKFDCSNP